MIDIFDFIKESEERDSKYYKALTNWFYNILVAVTALLGALIALSDNSEGPYNLRLSFALSVGLGILGVLLGCIALLFETVRARRTRSALRERLYNSRRGKEVAPSLSVTPPNFLLWLGLVSLVSFFLSLIGLMYYVVAKNLPELI